MLKSTHAAKTGQVSASPVEEKLVASPVELPREAVDPALDLTGLRLALESMGSASYVTMTPLECLLHAESPETHPRHVLTDMIRDIEATISLVKENIARMDSSNEEEIDTVLWMVLRKARAARSLSHAIAMTAGGGAS